MCKLTLPEAGPVKTYDTYVQPVVLRPSAEVKDLPPIELHAEVLLTTIQKLGKIMILLLYLFTTKSIGTRVLKEVAEMTDFILH